MLVRYTSLQPGALQAAGSNQLVDPSKATLDAIRSLTPRQQEVLKVMMQGKSNKGICRLLNLAEPTVKNYVTAILKALDVTNRTEAVIKVTRASALGTSYPTPPISYLRYAPVALPLKFR